MYIYMNLIILVDAKNRGFKINHKLAFLFFQENNFIIVNAFYEGTNLVHNQNNEKVIPVHVIKI